MIQCSPDFRKISQNRRSGLTLIKCRFQFYPSERLETWSVSSYWWHFLLFSVILDFLEFMIILYYHVFQYQECPITLYSYVALWSFLLFLSSFFRSLCIRSFAIYYIITYPSNAYYHCVSFSVIVYFLSSTCF